MPAPSSRPVILLVEDSDDDMFFFRHTLRKTDFHGTLVTISDGGEAIKYLSAAMAPDGESAWPDVLFLDLKLPTFNGFEILTWMEQHNLLARLHVLVLSGSEYRADIERAKTLGATDYCVKPLSPEQLAAHLAPWQPPPCPVATTEVSGNA
jgi:CheY-like chemotaxis protein